MRRAYRSRTGNAAVPRTKSSEETFQATVVARASCPKPRDPRNKADHLLFTIENTDPPSADEEQRAGGGGGGGGGSCSLLFIDETFPRVESVLFSALAHPDFNALASLALNISFAVAALLVYCQRSYFAGCTRRNGRGGAGRERTTTGHVCESIVDDCLPTTATRTETDAVAETARERESDRSVVDDRRNFPWTFQLPYKCVMVIDGRAGDTPENCNYPVGCSEPIMVLILKPLSAGSTRNFSPAEFTS